MYYVKRKYLDDSAGISIFRKVNEHSMICFVEVQCKKWEHNQVNAGFVNLVKNLCHEECQFWGEKEHIENLKKMVNFASIEIHEVVLPELIVDSSKNQKEYYDILKPIFKHMEQCEDVKIVFLSAHKGIVLATAELAKEYPHYRIFLTMHSIMEQLYHKNTWFHKLYRLILRGEHNLDWVLKKIDNKCENVRFIIYVPGYVERMKRKLPNEIINKFIFMHHPYIFNKQAEGNYNDKEISVAIIGAAVNNNARYVIEHCSNEIVFNVVQRTNVKMESPNVRVINRGKEISAEDIKTCIKKSSWLMIPYDKNQYKLTASGIFWDAIANYKPIIALDSEYLKDYMKENKIGIMVTKKKDLGVQIGNFAEEDYKVLLRNISSLIAKIESENKEIICKMFA